MSPSRDGEKQEYKEEEVQDQEALKQEQELPSSASLTLRARFTGWDTPVASSTWCPWLIPHS